MPSALLLYGLFLFAIAALVHTIATQPKRRSTVYEILNLTTDKSHGSFATMSEARAAVKHEALTDWAIYEAHEGGLVEWSRAPGVLVPTTNPRSPIASIVVADRMVEGMLARGR